MIRRPQRVVCAGNVVFDILVRPVGEIQFGRTTWVEAIEQHMGGNGANTSYTLARLGVPVKLHSAVGRDDFGSTVRAKLAEAGVDVTDLTEADLPTATTVALVHTSGSRAFLHRPGVSQEVFREPLDFAAASDGHFHLANVFALPQLRRTAEATLRCARERGYTTSLDTGWDARNEWITEIDPLLPFVDVMFLNEDEGEMLSGTRDEEAICRFFRERGVGNVVLKLGGRGCVLSQPGEALRHLPAFSVPVVDTTGAGDCFAGGFLAALYHGFASEDAAQFANAVGALAIQKLGATDGVCSFDETLAWMQSQ